MAYTEELANGIKLWAVNGVVVPLAILLWAIDIIPAFSSPVLFLRRLSYCHDSYVLPRLSSIFDTEEC